METTEISYSTLSPSAIVSRILPEYDLGEIVGCEFLTRGLNDTFTIRSFSRLKMRDQERIAGLAVNRPSGVKSIRSTLPGRDELISGRALGGPFSVR